MGAVMNKAKTQPRSVAHRLLVCAGLGTGTHCSFAYWSHPLSLCDRVEELRQRAIRPQGLTQLCLTLGKERGRAGWRLVPASEFTGSLKLIQDQSIRQNFEIWKSYFLVGRTDSSIVNWTICLHILQALKEVTGGQVNTTCF